MAYIEHIAGIHKKDLNFTLRGKSSDIYCNVHRLQWVYQYLVALEKIQIKPIPNCKLDYLWGCNSAVMLLLATSKTKHESQFIWEM